MDSGVSEGDVVSPFYDPMLGKLIAWGENREQARLRLLAMLDEFAIGGLKTNIAFLRRILAHPAFAAAELDTGFIPATRMCCCRRHVRCRPAFGRRQPKPGCRARRGISAKTIAIRRGAGVMDFAWPAGTQQLASGECWARSGSGPGTQRCFYLAAAR